MTPIELTDSNFEEVVLKSKLPVVIDLWAEWCGPCRMIAPHIEKMAEEYEGKAVICSLDVDSNPEVPTKYAVLNIPTVMFFKDGEFKERVVGAVPKKVLCDTLEKYF